jgi:hypothetical protein
MRTPFIVIFAVRIILCCAGPALSRRVLVSHPFAKAHAVGKIIDC